MRLPAPAGFAGWLDLLRPGSSGLQTLLRPPHRQPSRRRAPCALPQARRCWWDPWPGLAAWPCPRCIRPRPRGFASRRPGALSWRHPAWAGFRPPLLRRWQGRPHIPGGRHSISASRRPAPAWRREARRCSKGLPGAPIASPRPRHSPLRRPGAPGGHR